MPPRRSATLAITVLAMLALSHARSDATKTPAAEAELSAAESVRVWPGNEHGRVEAVIALRELSRIAVDRGRLAALIDYKQALHARKDDTTGQFFIAPREGGTKPINVFAIDEAGNTYALLLHPRDLPAQSVILKSAQVPAPPRRAPNLSRAIKDIVVRLSHPKPLDDPRVKRTNESIVLWDEARLLLTATLDAGELIGERYLLTNLTASELRLREEELYRDGVLAVSIAQHALAPAASTLVIVVRERRARE